MLLIACQQQAYASEYRLATVCYSGGYPAGLVILFLDCGHVFQALVIYSGIWVLPLTLGDLAVFAMANSAICGYQRNTSLALFQPKLTFLINRNNVVIFIIAIQAEDNVLVK